MSADGLKNDAAVSEDLSPSKSKRATTKPRGTVVPGATGTPDGSPNPNSIRVAVRIRPFSAKELGEGGLAEMVLDIVETTVISKGVDRYGHDSDYVKSKQFTFDSVFNSTDPGMEEGSQAQVFQELGVPILENALDAYNGCIMAYGQTGSGKSYSVLGDPASEKEQGLLPRACECLFEMISKQKQDVEKAGTPLQTAVLASYLEIYQEKMYDLLVNNRTDLQVRLHPTLGPHVPGLIQSPVSNSKEAVLIDPILFPNVQVRELLDFGAKNRVVGATSMNASSSRSHAVFTLDIRLSYSGAQARDLQSRIHFVDLAGSEKQKKTHASGERLQEGIAINQSLSALSRVIQALAGTAGSGILPVFRESKLTLLLKDALSGNSRTVLLACISPARANFEESISTLEFAARCKLIKTNAKKNEQDKRQLMETLSKEKQEIQERLEAERQQKLLLQQELEREVEESKKNQDLVLKMQEEKQRIEDRLRDLQIAEQQLQLARQQEQDEKEKEQQRLQRLNEEKEAELQQRLQQIDASHAESAEMERQLREQREREEREMQEREQKQQQEKERMQKKAQELAELQAKLQEVHQREEEERQRAAQTMEVELRQRIEEEMKRVQNREEDLKREHQGLQSLEESLALKNADIENKAQEQKMFRERFLKELGISGMEHDMEDAQKIPRLVNMNSDPSLEGCLVYYLPLGETRIGADQQQCDVCLAGLDVADQVCEIRNDENEKLEVVPSPQGLVRVNGIQVAEEGQELESGDRLAIGRAHIFRVVIPQNSSAEQDEEEDFETAMKELQANSEVDPRWRRGVDDAVMIVKQNYGTTKANLLLESAKAASEVVAEANAILKTVQSLNKDWRKGVSHYELAVLFQADGLPVVCVVARREEDQAFAAVPMREQGRDDLEEIAFSAGIWEAGRFEEQRLSLMYEAADALKRRPTRCPAGLQNFLDSVDTEKDQPSDLDWELQAFSEVELDTFQDLSTSYKELQLSRKKKEEEERKQEAGGQGLLEFLFGGRSKKGPEENKELVSNAPARIFEWLTGPLRPEKDTRPEKDPDAAAAAAAEKLRAASAKKARENRRDASEPLKNRRASMAPRGTLVPEGGASGHLEVPKSAMKRSSSSSTSSNRRAAAKDASPKGDVWPAAEDLLEKFSSSPKDDIRIDVTRLEAPIRRASKSGIEVVPREPSPTGGSSGSPSASQEDDRLTVEILVKELFNDDKLGVRLRMEGLVVSNFDVPEAADVGWHLFDEIVAVNGRSVGTREEFRTVLANARKQMPIVFTVKRQRPILGHGRARRTVAGARPHTEASSVGPRDRAAKRKARASTSVPYRIKDTE